MMIHWVILFLCCIVVQSELLFQNRAIDNSAKTLDLAKSGLNRLKNYFVNSSAITHVNLMDNVIGEIEAKAFKGLPNIVYLNLTKNKIPFEGLDFAYQSALEILVLDNALAYSNWAENNRILFNKATTFPKLKNLYLRGNHINSILLGGVLLGEIMPNITHIDLRDNNLKPMGFLNNIPKTLTHLYLDNNQISNVESYYQNNIKVLSVNKNNLQRLSDTNSTIYEGLRLKNFVYLEDLSVSDSSITNISLHALDDLGNLRNLNLSHNELSSLLNNTFNSLKSLVSLDLDHNLLQTVPNLCALKKLEFLSLSYNKISILRQSSFCGLPSLKMLNLSNNALKTVEPFVFNNMLTLEKLDLSKNMLVALPQNWIPVKINLQYLYVNDNKFVQFSSLSLEQAKNLKYVNIEHNQIKFIYIKSLKSLPENVTVEMA